MVDNRSALDEIVAAGYVPISDVGIRTAAMSTCAKIDGIAEKEQRLGIGISRTTMVVVADDGGMLEIDVRRLDCVSIPENHDDGVRNIRTPDGHMIPQHRSPGEASNAS